MRRAILAAITVAAVAIASHAIAAGRPQIVFFGGPGDIALGNLNDGPAGDVCAFPVDAVIHVSRGAHEIVFNGQGIGFAAADGGALGLTITNLDTGASVAVNISGPGRLSGEGLPVIGTGPWAIYEPISAGGIRFLKGRMRFVPSSYGVHAILLSGTEEDLCDRVA